MTSLNNINIKEIITDKTILIEIYLLFKKDNKSITIEKVEDILENGSGKDLSEVIQKYNSEMGQYLAIKTDPNEASQTT